MDPTSPLHILIIEDSPEDRAEIRRMLLSGSDQHYVFSEASKGGEGVKMAFAADPPPDCVFLDFSLPDMDALEALELLRRGGDLTICPVVVLTGSTATGDAVIPAGAQDYLGKSWASPQVLTRSVHNAIGRFSLARRWKKTADELRASEEFSRAVLRNSPDCVKVMDANGVLLLLNDPGVTLLELDDPSSILGKLWWELWPGESQDEIRNVVERACAGELVNFEQFCPTSKGRPRWWDVQVSGVPSANGKIERIVAVSRDITESKLARDVLEETGNRLALGMRASGIALGQIDYVANLNHLSAEAASLFGFGDRPMTLPRQQVHTVVHPEDRTDVETAIASSLNPEGDGFFVIDHRVILPTGEVRWVRAHKQVFFEGPDGAKKPVRGILALLDITHQKRTEIELADAAKRKDEFLAMLAHELRNPLAPLLTGMDVIVGHPDNPVLVGEIASMMKRQVDQMSRLIDDLLDVSRITNAKIKLKMGEVDLGLFIHQSVEAVRPLIDQKKHELVINNTAGDMKFAGDHHRLTQILSNLLSNAAKYTDPGGCIELHVGIHAENALKISVSDNGRGVARENQRRIFDLFDQGGGGPKDGLGIGLTLVKSLIEMHGGSISLSSEGEGKGSRFTITLPLSGRIKGGIEKTSETITSSGDKRRVLVAEDGRATADILCMFFKMEGLDCRVAYDGGAAVEEARGFHPQLACFDLGMPVMNGYEAARRVREMYPDIYLVALSGWGTADDCKRSMEAGFNQHLVKPVKPADLRKVLAKAFPFTGGGTDANDTTATPLRW